MRVLPVAEPAPAVGEPQIDAQAAERGIGVAQCSRPGAALPRLRLDQRLLQVERGIHHALGDRRPVGARETLRLGQQPSEQIEGPRVRSPFLGHVRPPGRRSHPAQHLIAADDHARLHCAHLVDEPRLAWRKAARGKRGTASVATFEYRAEEHLAALQEAAAARDRIGPGGLRAFHDQGPEAAQDQRRALPRPGGAPRPVQRDRAALRAAVHARQLRQPARQGHASRHRPAAGSSPGATATCCAWTSCSTSPPSTMPSCWTS